MNQPKILKFEKDARNKLFKGVTIVNNAVGSTLGPKGRNVAMSRPWGMPLVVHDGVTVAKEIDLEDKFADMGAQLIKEAAANTNNFAGDGTTTSTILAHAIVQEGLVHIEAGSNPMILKKGIEQAVEKVVEELKRMSKKLTTQEEQAQVATISAADPEIGKLIAKVIGEVGENGVVTVEEGKNIVTSYETKKGMVFERGFISPQFVNSDRQQCIIEDAYILLTDKRITSAQDLAFMEQVVSRTKNIVFIADSVEGEALAALVINSIRGNISAVAIHAPEFGDRRKQIMEDIAVLTGATIISDELGKSLSNVTLDDFGKARRVIVTKDSTTLVDGKGDQTKIDQRASQIKEEIKNSPSQFDKEKLEERLAKFEGGIAIISAGAMTEPEMKEKKERIIDAVAATKAAIAEGIIPGGETALLRASKVLDKLKLKGDEGKGVEIVKEALKKPFIKLVKNAGLNMDDQTLQDITALGENEGIDVMDGKVKDLIEAGIIDPVKVTRSALQNAASVACVIMTTDVLITDAPPAEQKINLNMPKQ